MPLPGAGKAFRRRRSISIFRNDDEILKALKPMVQVEQVRILYDQAASGLAVTLVVSLTLGTFLITEEATVPTIGTWWFTTVLVVAWRWRLIQRFHAANDVESNPAIWSKRFVVGAILAGLTWGIGGAVLAFEVSLLNEALILLVIAAMAATAILYLGSVVAAYVGYLLSATLPLLAWMLWQRDIIHLVIAVLTCVFIAGAWAAVLRFSRLLEQTLFLELKSKALADELRESEKLLKQAARITHLGHYVWDRTADEFVFVSDECASILGVTVDEVHKQFNTRDKYMMLVHPDDRNRVLAFVSNPTNRENSYNIEYRLIRPNGEKRHVREMGDPVLDHQGALIRNFGILQDITEQKQTEKALCKARDEMEERVEERTVELERRNVELEQFAYTISHDLKTPLVTVNGYVGLLDRDLKAGDADSIAKDMQHIVSAISKMDNSLEDLLELSRVGRVVNKPQLFSLNQLSDEVIAIMQGVLTKSEAEIEIAPDLPAVLADKNRVSDVMQNLLENAIKFCGEGNTPKISVDAEVQGKWVQCRVKDNGIGIDPRYHDKVFELFDRLNPRIDGTGVGLALVKRIIEVHDGEVWIESEGTGQGTQVYFTLPAAIGETR
jgi:PAS domain S-box-containing protein